MRILLAAILAVAAVPSVSGHGALAINEFDVYAISDFEGQEDSFPWEGWEIWDVYAGDGYEESLASHGVYFKANLAGDGTLRPSGSAAWTLTFSFRIGDQGFERTISHDGTAVETDFERLEWQIADGNVFQLHAWVPIEPWEGKAIEDLVVVSAVDGSPRDIAPGGIYDPVTGQEVPVAAPATPVFPAMGEGRIVAAVPLSGPSKWLDVAVTPQGGNAFGFNVTNPLSGQGQHFMFHAHPDPAWTLAGAPMAGSLDGGATTRFVLQFTSAANGTVAPFVFDLLTDIGGKQTYYAYLDQGQVLLTTEPGEADTVTVETPAAEAPGVPLAFLLVALILKARR